MTDVNFKDLILQPQYNFLRENKHLGSNIMFLALGGSHAYGLNVEGSDIDIRGVAIERKDEIFGLSSFEQVIDNPTDTTVYSLKKFASLCLACNPNVIEMLGFEPEDYVQISPAGKLLVENKKLFLSKKAINSFGGYANAQLRRLQNACARDRIGTQEQFEHVLKTTLFAIPKIAHKYNIEPDAFIVKASETKNENDIPMITLAPGPSFDNEIFDKTSLVRIGGFLRELDSIKDAYEKELTGRNRRAAQKSDKQLNKHAMHLVRLYLMAFDILEKGEINTFRKDDRDFLLSIRNGKYMNEDGLYVPEFFEMVNGYEKRLEYAAKNTALPSQPDIKKIEELLISIYDNFL